MSLPNVLSLSNKAESHGNMLDQPLSICFTGTGDIVSETGMFKSLRGFNLHFHVTGTITEFLQINFISIGLSNVTIM